MSVAIAALLETCGQGVLSVESQRADSAFDCVVVEIDAIVAKKADEAVPARKSVAVASPRQILG